MVRIYGNGIGNLSANAVDAMQTNINAIPAANWTPCADGLPKFTANYKVTVQVGSEMGTWRETMIIPFRICDGVGEWVLPKSDWLIYGVLAWTKADEPWTGEKKGENE